MSIEITGKVEGIKYNPTLGSDLDIISMEEFPSALSDKGSFLLRINSRETFAVSRWVSPKRTRSYPYARVYDTLGFTGKKVTIIPVIKDEGRGERKRGCKGDRDFLQWDTVSLMSLLGVYVIITYYIDAEKKINCENRITNQMLAINDIASKIEILRHYQSDALHWNLHQLDEIDELAEKALQAYKRISQKYGVEMHSRESALKRIDHLKKGCRHFMNFSRKLAQEAQNRESATAQPKEFILGEKATITIRNYLGGYYYFTCDEVELKSPEIYLIETKHTTSSLLPSANDVKDGLLKMILFTNLDNITYSGKRLKPVPVLSLTSKRLRDISQLSNINLFENLKEEARINGFKIRVNGKYVV